MESETLLLDEPLSNLDANLREEMRSEVRRLHDSTATPPSMSPRSVEAMTTADVIAVMNAGKIEQAGSPEEIYNRPRSKFVASFIGMSNVITGKKLNDNQINFAGTPLRVTGEPQPGEAAVSIRQHQISLFAKEPANKDNIVAAKIVRQVFLGSSRDYMVEVAGGTQLRVVTSAGEGISQGSDVWLHLPVEHCRALVS